MSPHMTPWTSLWIATVTESGKSFSPLNPAAYANLLLEAIMALYIYK